MEVIPRPETTDCKLLQAVATAVHDAYPEGGGGVEGATAPGAEGASSSGAFPSPEARAAAEATGQAAPGVTADPLLVSAPAKAPPPPPPPAAPAVERAPETPAATLPREGLTFVNSKHENTMKIRCCVRP